MALKIITPPTTEPISLQEAKLHLRVDIGDDDAYISSLIKTAREFCETFTKRAISTQTFEYTLDSFSDNTIRLPRPSLKSVDSITYKDKKGTEIIIDSSLYAVDTDSEPGRIVLFPGESWPQFEPYPVNAIRIKYTAGYQEIPESVKQAMLLLIGHWYENREAIIDGSVPRKITFAVDSLLWTQRVWW